MAWLDNVVSVPVLEEMIREIHIVPCFVSEMLGVILPVALGHCQLGCDADFRGPRAWNAVGEVFTIRRVLLRYLGNLE